MKSISIIIPVYNGERTVRRTLESIMAQTVKDIEIVVVNDGSTDGTNDILAELENKDSRLRVLRQENQGVSRARTNGLAAAKGDIILWIDADDYAEPQMVEALVAAMEKTGAPLAAGNYENVPVGDESRRRIRYKWNGDRVIDSDQALRMIVAKDLSQSLCCALAAERWVWDAVSFRAGTLFEDVDNTYKLYLKAKKIALVDQLLMTREIQKVSISHDYRLSKRLESAEVYITRQSQLRKVDPELDKLFYHRNMEIMTQLRKGILQGRYRAYRPYRARIKAVCADFRAHKQEAVGMYGLKKRLQYHFMTSGSYTGFWMSRLLGNGGWMRYSVNNKNWTE